MKTGLNSYQRWQEIARQWDRCIDFASPMNTWTDAMLREHREKREGKIAREKSTRH